MRARRSSRGITRRVVASLAVVAAILGLSLASAGTAAAATGTWVPYGNTNPITSSSSDWFCADSRKIATNVAAQVCVVRSAGGGHVQGAVIVRNNRSTLVGMTAAVDLRFNPPNEVVGVWNCALSGVGANSWSVCFGATRERTAWTQSFASVNGTDNLGGTEWV